MTLEQFLSNCLAKTAGYSKHTPSGMLRLAAKMLQAIVEGQHARDLSSDPAVYIEFNPIWIAYEILSGAQGSPLTKDELIRRQKGLDDYNQDAAEQRYYDAQSSPARDGGAE